MRDARVNGLPVADDAGRVVGFLDVQDIVGLRLEV
jgi:CBS domain-containing protein